MPSKEDEEDKKTPMLERSEPTEQRSEAHTWSANLCTVYSVVCVVLLFVARFALGVAPRESAAPVEVMKHAQNAMFLVLSATFSEMCLLLSSSADANYAGRELRQKIELHGIGDSALTLIEYTFKTVTALYVTSFHGGMKHVDLHAPGGPRIVYMARYAQWSVAVPLFMYIGYRIFLNEQSHRSIVRRCLPSMAAAMLYCWCSWASQVTTNSPMRAALLFSSIVGPVFVGIDQVKLALEHRQDQLFSWKMGVVCYQITVMTAYGVVFFVARAGLLNSTAEQLVYCYADSSICILQGALLSAIRNREALLQTHRWYVAAESAKEDLENLMHRASVPVFALDVDGTITAWNSSLEILTGQQKESVIGRPLKDLICVESQENLDVAISTAIKACTEAEEVTPAVKVGMVVANSKVVSTVAELAIPLRQALPNGVASRRLAMNFVPHQTDDGALAGVMAIGQDLSEIAELKIIQERKSALMALLSHELRSPLHGVLGLTQSLLSSPAGKTMSKQLGMISGCAARLLDLVANIMDLAQTEKQRRENGGQAPMPESPVDFGAIAEEVASMTMRAVDKANRPLVKPSVRLVNNLAGHRIPIIKGDMHKCTQLMYNLVTNACKFTDRGSVSFNFRFVKEEQRLEIDVTDTGRGISEVGQKRIFQAFEQESSGDTRSFQGIGLGLAVCTEICELHRGQLRVSSHLGQGSTFTISLPCDESLGYGEPHAENLSEDLNRLMTADSPPQRSKTQPWRDPDTLELVAGDNGEKPLILSVDDDDVNQEVVRSALSPMCEVFCAMDGMQALSFLREQASAKKKMPDVVLLDIQMPGMDGFEVCQEIRKGFEAAHANLPVVMVSAKAPMDQTAIRGYISGATDFVPKPFNPEVIKHKVQVILSIHRRASLGCSMSIIMKEADERVQDAKADMQTKDQENTVLQEEVKTLKREMLSLKQLQAQSLADQQQLATESADLRRVDERAELRKAEEASAQEQMRARAAEEKAKAAEDKAGAFQAELDKLKREMQELHDTSRREQEEAEARARNNFQPLLSSNVNEPSRLIEEQKSELIIKSKELLCANVVMRAIGSRIDAVDRVSKGCRNLLELPAACANIFPDAQGAYGSEPAAVLKLAEPSKQHVETELRAYREVSQVVYTQLALLEQLVEQPLDWLNRLEYQSVDLPLKFGKGTSSTTSTDASVEASRGSVPAE